MAELTVTVNRRRYPIRCAEGEEDRVRRLAEDLDRRVSALRNAIGPIDDARLLLMAALLLADEREELQAAGRRPGVTSASPATASGDTETLAARLNQLADRIEAVAARLEAP